MQQALADCEHYPSIVGVLGDYREWAHIAERHIGECILRLPVTVEVGQEMWELYRAWRTVEVGQEM